MEIALANKLGLTSAQLREMLLRDVTLSAGACNEFAISPTNSR